MDAAIVDNPVKGRCYPRGITPHNFAELPSMGTRKSPEEYAEFTFRARGIIPP